MAVRGHALGMTVVMGLAVRAVLLHSGLVVMVQADREDRAEHVNK